MTIIQAYTIIGVTKNDDMAKIEMAYRQKLKKLQLQLTTGQSLPIRQRALHQIEQLSSAMEVIQNNPPQPNTPQSARSQRRDRSQNNANSKQTQDTWRELFDLFGVNQSPSPKEFVGAILIFMTIMGILFMCLNASSSHTQDKPALLRVISVPWCHVELDGESLGTSGQAKAFELSEGKYCLTFRNNNETLTKTIKLYNGRQALVKVQFEKGYINVDYE